MRAGELAPDLGPPAPHPSAGATLVTARPPLAAFNVELDTGDVEVARAVAAQLRESGGGLAGVRAVGVDLDGRAQVSTNVDDPVAVPLAAVIERVRELAAEHGARPVAGEVVGLVPEAAHPRPPRGRAAARLRPRAAPARAAARRASERRPRLGTLPADGADEEATPQEAPGDPDRPDRQPRAARAAAHARGGQGAGAPEALHEGQDGQAGRIDPRDRPPTWASAFKRGLIGAVIFFLLFWLAFGRPMAAAAGLSVVMLAMYVPLGYYIDRFMYRRRMRQQQAARAAKQKD